MVLDNNGQVQEAGCSSNATNVPSEVKTEIEESAVVGDPSLRELRTLFDNCKQIAPGNAFDVIGEAEH